MLVKFLRHTIQAICSLDSTVDQCHFPIKMSTGFSSGYLAIAGLTSPPVPAAKSCPRREGQTNVVCEQMNSATVLLRSSEMILAAFWVCCKAQHRSWESFPLFASLQRKGRFPWLTRAQNVLATGKCICEPLSMKDISSLMAALAMEGGCLIPIY